MLQMLATIVSASVALGALSVVTQSLLDYRDEIRLALAGPARPSTNVARVRLVGRPRRMRSIRIRPVVSSPVSSAPLHAAA